MGDNAWRAVRELHIWSAAFSSTLMSGRLDAFFSLSLCHALIACILFAGALSFYAPLATSYYQLASLTAVVYWLVVIFILTVLTASIQLVMRMVRVGSGELVQRYQRVGVLLANPQPVKQDHPRSPTFHRSLALNNSSNASWTERWRRLTDRRQNNNNNNNDNDNSTVVVVDHGVVGACGEFLSSVGELGLDRACVGPWSSWSSTSRKNSTQWRSLSAGGDRSSNNRLYSCDDLTASPRRNTDRVWILDELAAGVSGPPSVHEGPGELLPALPSLSSSSASWDSDDEVDGTPEPVGSSPQPGQLLVDVQSALNVNNNNGEKDGADSTQPVSVTVSSRHRQDDADVLIGAGGHERRGNFSSNAGVEDVPRVSRHSSAQRPSGRESEMDEPVNLLAGSGSGSAPQRKSSMTKSVSREPRRSSATGRQSSVERRRSSREVSIADRRSSGQVSRSSASFQGDEVERRRSSGLQEARRSSAYVDGHRGSAAAAQEAGRSSASQEARRSSAALEGDELERRRSSGGAQEASRQSSRALEVSDEAARRSLAEGRSVGEFTTSPSSVGRRDSTSEFCCEPVPASPCCSCCRPGVRPHTCWCRCASELHNRELLDDCCGSRDSRLLSLPDFPRNKPSCNTCFTPCRYRVLLVHDNDN